MKDKSENLLSVDEIQNWVKAKIGRRLHMAAVHLGREGYSLGFEGFLTAKGLQGHLGLETYPCFQITRYREATHANHVVEKLMAGKADILLLSYQIYPEDPFIKKEVKELGQNRKLPRHLVKVIVGEEFGRSSPRFLGYDLGLGEEISPLEAAQKIVYQWDQKMGSARHEGRASHASHEGPSLQEPKRSLWNIFGRK
ncbi:MAG: hypothetical protein A3I75_00660 [Deltaproteobacteria bacterium RIFCSPLOWO2_02_FULL_50_16]|nr:MAG: hypothetical protein A3B79_03485 [Deltaproteobacteria bacterium RIFCSPHIGHO2_02_FULL_50_15]OGQ56340.1 MAG: hypothetical protein A3I75_00660 [Deltaproteobacteria bacterium RIFCSPLOWO2_02_FULL_50_16]OGQ67743.1 MAG: hypothetical protein A3F89_01905 [Deltaproteobacteria bacterium RIFCSPLOWO2_12_FULL_50_11]